MIPNPYSYDETIDQLRHYFTAINRPQYFVLLEKAIDKAKHDVAYAAELKNTLLHGGTCERRELFSPFGDYMARTSDEIPRYPHHDAVNAIDSAMLHIKLGDTEESIEFYNLMHN